MPKLPPNVLLVRVEDPEVTERARRAAEKFRRDLLKYRNFARVITRNSKIRVAITAGTPCTDGSTIWLRPPIQLGDDIKHDRMNCGLRDERQQYICPACLHAEDVLVTLYHEIAHISEGSFEPVSEYEKRNIIADAVKLEAKDSTSRAAKLAERLGTYDPSWIGVANKISPFLGVVVNAVEDARVNQGMWDARPGTKTMFDSQTIRIFEDGIEGRDGKKVTWKDAPPNGQAIIAVYCKASSLKYDGWLDPTIVQVLDDPELDGLCARAVGSRSPRATYKLAFPILERLRELGFCKAPEDPEDEPKEEEPEQGNAGDQGDSSEPPPETEEEPEPQPGETNEGDPSSSENEESESDEDAEPQPGEGAESDDEDESEEEQEDQEQGTGAGDADDEADDESEEDEEQPSSSADTGSSDQPQPGTDVDDDDSEDFDEDDVDSDPDEGDDDDNFDEDDEDEFDDDNLGNPEDDSGDDADPSQDATSAPAPATADAGNDPGTPDTPDPDNGPENDDKGTSSEEEEPQGDTFNPEDAGEFDGENPERLEMDPAAPTLGDPDIDGTAEEVEHMMKVFGRHEGPKGDVIQPGSKQEEQELNRAVVQGEYFDSPSRSIFGVNVHEYDRHVIDDDGWDLTAQLGWKLSGNMGGDITVPEQILAPALLKTRIAFADNRKAKLTRNLKSGSVDAKVLARRVPVDDQRLFGKKKQPGRKDYFVVIGLDISGSTTRSNVLQLIKKGALAKAELMHRLGVKFAVYAHSGSSHGSTGHYHVSDDSPADVDIFVVKAPNEAWSDKTRDRLRSLTACAFNLDGHTLEFYRKVAERAQETDKIILYYTDGAMPLENYDEELEVLQREIATCKRKGIHLIGVAIKNSDPEDHGLETVRIDGVEDVGKVVKALEKKLAYR